MKIIVGLGNPGDSYKNTLHNIGFIVLDEFASQLGLNFSFESKFNAFIAKNSEYILVKPSTFMNNSGYAVSKVVDFYKSTLDNLIVIHDDLDLPPNSIRFQKGVGSAGHNGVSDIIEKLNSKDFYRLRVGIGRPSLKSCEVSDYVLSKIPFEINFSEILRYL